MSYDMCLRDPVTHEIMMVPGHLMFGGNIPCEYKDGQFLVKPSEEAYLNITYNYAPYYYSAFPGVNEKNGEAPEGWAEDVVKYGIKCGRGGIRSLNGMTGAEAIPLLKEMIRRIEEKYKAVGGEWITTEREEKYLRMRATGERKHMTARIDDFFKWSKQGYDPDEISRMLDERYEDVTEKIRVNEGPCDNYWTATAANAIKPLYQLIAMSTLRPEGVWSEES